MMMGVLAEYVSHCQIKDSGPCAGGGAWYEALRRQREKKTGKEKH